MPPDDEIVRLNRRLDQMEMNFNERLREAAEEVADLRQIVNRLSHQPAVAGTFPPITQIDRIGVQIFDNTATGKELTVSQKRSGTTHWSLKFEYWVDGRKNTIVVRMSTSKSFLQNLSKPAPAGQTPASEFILKRARLISKSDTALGGIVRKKRTQGKGRPFVPSQACILLGHDEQDIKSVIVYLMIGEEVAAIDSFRDAKGTEEGHALWYGSWIQPDTE